MRVYKTALITGAAIAAMAAATLVASSAGAQTTTTSSTTTTTTYIVCNRWAECWKTHEKYTTYPSDARIVWHDDAWREAHEHDGHFHWLKDPDDDHGWYDKDGTWHPFAANP